MAKTDPLAQLKDIHLPEAISWWPLAPGWYVLLVLIAFAGAFLTLCLYKRYRYALAKKYALILLTTYEKDYEQEQNSSLISARISELLRRVALVYYPRHQVASLHGKAWLDFLNQTGKGIDFNLVQEMLFEAPFKPRGCMNLKPLFHSAKLWIQQRSVPCSN